MRKRLGWITACGLGACLAAVPSASAQGRMAEPRDAPLVLDVREKHVRVVPSGSSFLVHATNRGTKTIVSYGVLVLRRDNEARPQPLRRHVVRPRQPLAPQQAEPVLILLDGPSPEYLVRPTFVLFEDGTWFGDGDAARHEIAALREEVAAARDMSLALAVLPERPDRAALVSLAERLSQGLARASTSRGRQQYEASLETLARVLDERTRGGRTYEEAITIVRIRLDRVLGRAAQYPFIVNASVRKR